MTFGYSQETVLFILWITEPILGHCFFSIPLKTQKENIELDWLKNCSLKLLKTIIEIVLHFIISSQKFIKTFGRGMDFLSVLFHGYLDKKECAIFPRFSQFIMPNLNYSELFETLNSVFIDSKFSRTSLNPQNKS